MLWENLDIDKSSGEIKRVEADEKKIALTAMLAGMNKDAEEDANKISLYLCLAGHKILQRCYPFGAPKGKKQVPDEYGALQCEIAAYLINKQGAEGQTSHSENGVSRAYESGGVPESFLSQITPMGAIF